MAFADFTGLSVNDTALEIKTGNVILTAIIQNKYHTDRVGITEVYSTGALAGGGAVLRVPKVPSETGVFRTLGATTNGGFFNTNDAAIRGLTEELIQCKYIYDQMVDVPEAQHVLSLAGASAVGVRSERIGKQIAKQMNAGTLAHQMVEVINAVITAGAETGRIFTYAPATDGDALYKFNDMCAALDDGDDPDGASFFNDTYPTEGRLFIGRPSFFTDLRKKGSIIIGGSNYAQDILKSGAVDSDTVLPDMVEGYRGIVNNVIMMQASKAMFKAIESWMVLSTTGAAVASGYLDNIAGILVAWNATGRGYAFPEQVKVIDSPNGVGLRIQPLANFGVEVFFEEGIKLLADATFVEGATALAVNAPGSIA